MVDEETEKKHKIDRGELIEILGRGGRVVVDLTKFADGASGAEVQQLIADIETLAQTVRDALQD